MNKDKAWVNRIRQCMSDLNIDRETLARRLGVTIGAIGHYLTGRNEPNLEMFTKIAKALKTTPAYLLYGISTTSDTPQKIDQEIADESVGILKNKVPIISWEQVDEWNDKTCQRLTQAAKDFVPYVHSNHSPCYALRVEGDAMSSPQGHTKSFREGEIIIVDPKQVPKHNAYVIALLPKTRTATFKQYVSDGGVHYLKPLNSQYPTMKIDESIEISGVVVMHIDLMNLSKACD